MYKYQLKMFAVVIMLFLSIPFCGAQIITIDNNSDKILKDYTVEIPLKKLSLKVGNYIATSSTGEKLPIEIISDLQGNQKLVFPVSQIAPQSVSKFKIQQGYAEKYPKRTYAEISHKIGGKFVGKDYTGGFSWIKTNYLRKPDEYTDHSYFIKYEGPGWESDKVAFRFYLDWRNGIDVFGKKTSGIVLPTVGVEDYEKYHHIADWGMDNMKVGKSLGLGSIAFWDGEKAVRVEKTDSVISYIPADGKVRSQVMTTYYGWNVNGTKCNLKSLISIDAGSRASHIELLADKDIPFATGIVKDKNGELILPEKSNKKWSYIATFGKQSLNNDMQGLVIFYRTKQLKKITSDELNHVILFSPENGCVDYYFMPTWELDWEPVADKVAFQRCIDEVLNRLNAPVAVSFKK
ncbi:conserved exported hypothetical protein [uncultured Paludibacter sp.]|nr:conserved exported hypothetical protein [uncultured Paludibacter sp.]